jgi:hypothetical protein
MGTRIDPVMCRGDCLRMNIDFINDGSHDAPLLRLFSGQKDEIELLRSNLMKLSGSELNEVDISGLPISSSRLKLTFKTGKTDIGIKISKDKKEFTVELSSESWLEMAEKLDPFLIDQTGFAWLFESSTIFILFTTDGYW